MKTTNAKWIILFLMLIVMIMLTSFKLYNGQSPNAVTEKINGVDVYVFSAPVREYTVIKTAISNGLVFDHPDKLVLRSAKRAYEEKGDAVIVHLSNYRYEVIKYK